MGKNKKQREAGRRIREGEEEGTQETSNTNNNNHHHQQQIGPAGPTNDANYAQQQQKKKQKQKQQQNSSSIPSLRFQNENQQQQQTTSSSSSATNLDLENSYTNFPNKPQLQFNLSRARKAYLNPRDISNLVCQSIIPIEHSNYPTIEPGQQWYSLMHGRNIPAVVCICVPGLPHEVLLSAKYLQPEKIVFASSSENEQQEEDQQEKEKEKEKDEKKSKNNTGNNNNEEEKLQEDQEEKKNSDNNNNNDKNESEVFSSICQKTFSQNPWFRHIRRLKNVSVANIWLHHTTENSNIANEFFFRQKPSVPTNSNKKLNIPASLGPAVAFIKAKQLEKIQQQQQQQNQQQENQNSEQQTNPSNSKNNNQQEEKESSTTTLNNDNNNNIDIDARQNIDFEGKEIPQQILDLWNNIIIKEEQQEQETKVEENSNNKNKNYKNSKNNNKQQQKPKQEPATLSQLALDLENLKMFGYPFQTEREESMPDPQQLPIFALEDEKHNTNSTAAASASATTNNANSKKDKNQKVLSSSSSSSDDEDIPNKQQQQQQSHHVFTGKTNNNDDENEEDSSSLNKQALEILAKRASRIPLPQYQRLFSSQEQELALKYFREQMMMNSSSSSSSKLKTDSSSSAPKQEQQQQEGNHHASPLARPLSATFLDEELKKQIDTLIQQLKHDIEISSYEHYQQQQQQQQTNNNNSNNNKKERIPVSCPGSSSSSSYHAIALDCEMIQTECWGSTLARLTLIEAPSGKVICDILVKPTNYVYDYVSRYSGIHSWDLEDIQLTFESARLLFKLFVSQSTFVSGHSVENDYVVCRVFAEPETVVDTAQLYPNPRGLPFRNSLKYLAFGFLNGRCVQSGSSGHDSCEDARTAMDLVSLKLVNGINFGMPNRINIMSWWSSSSSQNNNNNMITSHQNQNNNESSASSSSSVVVHDENSNNNSNNLLSVQSYLFDRNFVTRKVSISDTNIVNCFNDGRASHGAEKALKNFAKFNTKQAPGSSSNSESENKLYKSFVWSQFYDAPLRDDEPAGTSTSTAAAAANSNVSAEQQQQQQQDSATTTTTTKTDFPDKKEEKEEEKAKENEEEEENQEQTLSSLLKEHVTSLHRRIHRVINAAPNNSLILVCGFAYPNTVTEQERHSVAHGMCFGFIKEEEEKDQKNKNDNVDEKKENVATTTNNKSYLPEDDNMFSDIYIS